MRLVDPENEKSPRIEAPEDQHREELKKPAGDDDRFADLMEESDQTTRHVIEKPRSKEKKDKVEDKRG